MEDLDQKIATLDAKLDAVKAGSKDPVGFSYKCRNSFYQPRDKPRGRLEGSYFRCGQYGHYKLGARKNPPGAEAKKGPQEQSASWSNGPTENSELRTQNSEPLFDIPVRYIINITKYHYNI